MQEGFASAALAYNDAIKRAKNDLLVFVHQDVILPKSWIEDLRRSLDCLRSIDSSWGVLGCFGITLDGGHAGYLFSPGVGPMGLGILGAPFTTPQHVRTLDEVVLITRRSSGLLFDESLPHFHMYGTDLCLRASAKGMQNYAICAFCIHNANHYVVLPKEFYRCCSHIRRTWREALPIFAPCIHLTHFNMPVYRRLIREIILRFRLGPEGMIERRATDISKLLCDVDRALRLSSGEQVQTRFTSKASRVRNFEM